MKKMRNEMNFEFPGKELYPAARVGRMEDGMRGGLI
jgi:hypothetical protein